MRGLFRSVLGLFTGGSAMTGRSSSNSPDDSGGSVPGPEDTPHQAAFRVPGMT
jgi:hypothetical protein